MSIVLETWEPYRRVKALEQRKRYYGAIIFGSVARDEWTLNSDLDVKVVVDEANSCENINHPIIDGVKLDVTFISLAQLQTSTHAEIEKAERVPLIAEAIIVFDKTGELAALKDRALLARPKALTQNDHQFIQFMLYHANNKVERHLDSDPAAGLVVMHVSFTDLLRMHYQICGRWWLSDKRLLRDLRQWDPQMAALVERFVVTNDVGRKFALWTEIVDYIIAPLGGRQPISANNCDCDICRQDLAALQNS